LAQTPAGCETGPEAPNESESGYSCSNGEAFTVIPPRAWVDCPTQIELKNWGIESTLQKTAQEGK
jgi:hypothetical protein